MAYAWNKSSPTTSAVAMFNLKTLLKAQGWTVPASSDGSTYNSSGDQITSGSSGANGMANNSAWFRIQDPAGTSEFVIQRGTTNVLWRIKHSRSAKFTGGSPGTTQVASATDELICFGAGTDAAPTYTTLFGGTEGAYRFNCGADSSAPYTFWAGAFPNGGGSPTMAFVYDTVVAGEPTDAAKHVIYAGGPSSHLPFGVYASTGMADETGVTTNGSLRTYVPSTGTGSVAYVHAGALLTYNNNVAFPAGLPTNPVTSKDEAFPLFFVRRSALATPFFKGASSVMRMLGVGRSTGDTLTVSTTRDRIVYRDLSLPWDGSVPTV